MILQKSYDFFIVRMERMTLNVLEDGWHGVTTYIRSATKRVLEHALRFICHTELPGIWDWIHDHNVRVFHMVFWVAAIEKECTDEYSSAIPSHCTSGNNFSKVGHLYGDSSYKIMLSEAICPSTTCSS